MALTPYHNKRDFKKTPEPKGRIHKTQTHFFGVQKHAASHLHYDFRLALEGVLKSWAVPKGPCLDPKVKRLAVHVEDHPMEYGTFEGIIPKGQYGGGTVMLWDQGQWEALDEDPIQAYKNGHLRFILQGKKLKGRWDLIRFKSEGAWFLIKYQDAQAKPLSSYDITLAMPLSVATQRDLDEISNGIKKPAKKKRSIQAPEAPFPHKIDVQLATLVDKPPAGEAWLHEVKFDGYRIIALKMDKQVTLVSRNHHDWTSSFLHLAEKIKKLPVKNAVFDGEIGLLDEQGRTDFQLLQNAVKASGQAPFIYYLFDLLYLEKQDCRGLPLIERKNLLASILTDAPTELHYSEYMIDHGEEMFKHACKFGLEGIISKRVNGQYQGKRSESWLKVKCVKRQEFVVGGFSKPQGGRSYFGSLFLGVSDSDGKLKFTGNVGTGFTDASLKALHQELSKLIIDKCPFNTSPPGSTSATWVKPKLIVEVAFTQWTKEGRLRHPSFKGLRTDKKAKEVIMEKSEPVEKVGTKMSLTHPQKVLYAEDGLTKQDLYDYYEVVAPYMLPYISQRLLSLVRCPSTYETCFYQKHVNESGGIGLHAMPLKGKRGETKDYVYLDDQAGLLSLVQMSVLEIHPWGSTIQHLTQPDVLIFDLDPAPDVPWKMVVAAAFDVKQQLEQLHLTSFVKTTGGKGLHVVIPIQPEHNWDIIKNFTHVFVEYMEMNHPEKYISKMSKIKRQGKIFLDYLRNQENATAIAPYSTRARLHAPVATPVHWDELTNNIKDTYYTMKTLPRRLEALKEDPWGAFWKIKQSLNITEPRP